MFDREAILNKCRKILAIQDSKGATPAEAANAAALLKRMLEKYQLSMADVEAGLRKDGIVEVKIKHHDRLFHWQRDVYCFLAQAFDCQMIMTKARVGIWVSYVGCASDVTIAEYYTTYFFERLQSPWEAYKTLHGGSHVQKANFWYAAAGAVHRRIKEMRPEAKTPDVPDNGARGLVLIKDGLLNSWLEEQQVKNAPKRREMEMDPHAYLYGQRAGQQLQLQEGLAHV